MSFILLISLYTFSLCAAKDPTCSNGLLYTDKTVCAPEICTQVCGEGCYSAGPGRNCCCYGIRNSGRLCSVYDAPCIMASLDSDYWVLRIDKAKFTTYKGDVDNDDWYIKIKLTSSGGELISEYKTDHLSDVTVAEQVSWDSEFFPNSQLFFFSWEEISKTDFIEFELWDFDTGVNGEDDFLAELDYLDVWMGTDDFPINILSGKKEEEKYWKLGFYNSQDTSSNYFEVEIKHMSGSFIERPLNLPSDSDKGDNWIDYGAVKGGDGYIQFGYFRIGYYNDEHFVISSLSNMKKTVIIFRSDGKYFQGPRSDFGLWDEPLNFYGPTNIKFTSNGIEFKDVWCIGLYDYGHLVISHKNTGKTAMIWRGYDGKRFYGPRDDFNCWNGKINNVVTVSNDKEFIQFNDLFRMGVPATEISGGSYHMSIQGRRTIVVYRDDGTVHPGPRDDWGWNKYDYQDNYFFAEYGWAYIVPP